MSYEFNVKILTVTTSLKSIAVNLMLAANCKFGTSKSVKSASTLKAHDVT